ncbi:5-methyltetrahydropteroyltriglutamate--homocysteine S-methyltransferase [Povalibacter sp.]|uniref:5-methyltetrahydropteroyltriglutamate-- homocysteine S-methyltransferase n=1 Tax=Povalibacter sp. TaxID=1962978 RepID=UPI002F3FC42A
MTATTPHRPTFRAEHVGSYLRPERLLQAARGIKSGTTTTDHLHQVQDDCIRELVTLQESVGMSSVTDGEFRRRGWSAGFIDAVQGFGMRDGTLGFRDEHGEKGVLPSPFAKERLQRRHGIATDEFRFLHSVARTGIPKTTIPSPDVMHFFLGPQSFDVAAYPDTEHYYAGLVQIYHDEIRDLAALGCRYLQLDNTALPCNCDDHVRDDVRRRGEDPDALTARYVQLVNDVLTACPAGMAKATHMCRGNLKGAWMAEGGYEAIAEKVFGDLNVDAFLLEFDTDRAGDFRPLRFVPPHKKVVLGLVSSKIPTLEDADDLKRRIDAAAKHIPLAQLGLSPQCGFSSVPGSGHPLTQDDQKRKMELIVEVARDVWGET